MDSSSAPPSKFSIRNVLALAIPLAVLVGAGGWYYMDHTEKEQAKPTDVRSYLRQNLIAPAKLDDGLVDGDGDLVAATPKDAKELIDPETLVFAVLGGDDEKEEEHFTDLAKFIEKKTGHKVKVIVWDESMDSQMKALRDGELHIAALSTGSVSYGVNKGGLVPFCVMADNTGKFGYNMEIIVPAASSAKTPADLKGKQLGCVSSYSFSGFKAPIVLLWKDFGMQPEIDYFPRHQGGQKAVAKEVAKGKLPAGAVASDLLKRMIAKDEIDGKSIRSIYKSPDYPTACYGYAHQLKPELAAKIKEAFIEFPWKGSSLETAFAAADQTKFVPITYKTDWAEVRRMEAEALRLVEADPKVAQK